MSLIYKMQSKAHSIPRAHILTTKALDERTLLQR